MVCFLFGGTLGFLHYCSFLHLGLHGAFSNVLLLSHRKLIYLGHLRCLSNLYEIPAGEFRVAHKSPSSYLSITFKTSFVIPSPTTPPLRPGISVMDKDIPSVAKTKCHLPLTYFHIRSGTMATQSSSAEPVHHPFFFMVDIPDQCQSP